MADRDDRRVAQRAAEMTPEEQAAGTDDPKAQAEAILEDSDTRTRDRDAAPDAIVEHRGSEDVVPDPPD